MYTALGAGGYRTNVNGTGYVINAYTAYDVIVGRGGAGGIGGTGV
jgi:hypothetical protein